MSYRTRGDLSSASIINEQQYGNCPSGDMAHGGTILTIKDNDTVTREPYWSCGKRTPDGHLTVARGSGYSMTANLTEGQNLITDWFARAGITKDGSAARELGSHSLMVRAAPQEWHLFEGSTVDTLELSCSELGGFVELKVDARSRVHSFAYATNTFKHTDGTDIGNLKPSSCPTGAPIVGTALWTYKDTDGVQRPVPADSWSLTVSNNLTAHPGLSAQNDGIRLEDGYQPTVGDLDITLTLEVPSNGPEYDLIRLSNDTVFEYIELDIDGVTICLDKVIIDPAGPSRTSEGGYTESVVFHADDMKVIPLFQTTAEGE